MTALDERKAVVAHLKALKESAATDFLLTEAEYTALRENLRELVLKIHDIEYEAVTALQSAMG
jgi:hypothetical protein